jgi:hypothetical protein
MGVGFPGGPFGGPGSQKNRRWRLTRTEQGGTMKLRLNPEEYLRFDKGSLIPHVVNVTPGISRIPVKTER